MIESISRLFNTHSIQSVCEEEAWCLSLYIDNDHGFGHYVQIMTLEEEVTNTDRSLAEVQIRFVKMSNFISFFMHYY